MKKMEFFLRVDDYTKEEIVEIEDEYDNEDDICSILEDWMRTNVKYCATVIRE